MQDTSNAGQYGGKYLWEWINGGQEECRTGGKTGRRDAGHLECRKFGMEDIWDAGLEICRTSRDAGHEGCRPGGMQDKEGCRTRMDAGHEDKEGCRTEPQKPHLGSRTGGMTGVQLNSKSIYFSPFTIAIYMIITV